jgi:hypothetical protein
MLKKTKYDNKKPQQKRRYYLESMLSLLLGTLNNYNKNTKIQGLPGQHAVPTPGRS